MQKADPAFKNDANVDTSHLLKHINIKETSVGDPDPHVFGPPGSGFICRRSGSGSFPFLIKVLSGPKYWLQNKILTQNLEKYSILRQNIMSLQVS
jgi:hypothetical protein